MSYPECERDDCRFTDEGGGTTTLMWDPIIYDKEGRPVEGGGNHRTLGVACHTCGKRWTSSATELDDAQGKPREWEEIKQR